MQIVLLNVKNKKIKNKIKKKKKERKKERKLGESSSMI